MSRQDTPENQGTGGGLSILRFAFYAALAVLCLSAGFLTALLLQHGGTSDGDAGEASTPAALPVIGKLLRLAEPKPIADLEFKGADGKPHRLSEWRGKVILLNLWATWCAPCEAEMPSLDRLQAKLGGDDFTVLAISEDRIGPEKPAAFFAKEGIKQLALYIDGSASAIASLQAAALPLSVVLDREGREVARRLGPAAWDSPATAAELAEFIRAPASAAR